MSPDLIAVLREKIQHLEKMRRNLKHSLTKIKPWWRVDTSFDDWSPDQLESLAAFKMRFSEMQDHLASAMKLIAIIEEQDTRQFTYVLNYMARLFILDGIEEWRAIRDLRNAATHDYSASEEEKALHFHRLLQNSDFLLDTSDRLKRFVTTAYPANKGKDNP